MANIIILDDNIIDTIMELNTKGYTTMFSCGGHVGDENTEIYIVIKRTKEIDNILEEKIIPILPDGFIIQVQDGEKTYDEFKNSSDNDWINEFTPDFFHRITIRTNRDISMQMVNNQNIIDEYNDKLYNFVKLLPGV